VNSAILGLVFAYVLLALLLLNLGVYTAWSWWIKAVAIVLTSGFYWVSYLAYDDLLGWATPAPIPQRFRLLAGYVEEPSKLKGSSGQIYLWISSMQQGLDDLAPRSHRLPYDNDLHARVLEANTKLKRGQAQLGAADEIEGEIPGRWLRWLRGGQKSVKIKFIDMPDPLFPDK
jgi:hypothetical protein